MSKFYKDANRWMTFQIIAIACRFLIAIEIITVDFKQHHYQKNQDTSSPIA
jgi:hypothetical protein